MDALSSVLSRIALRAGVFYSGNICGLHDFEHDVFKGHLHLIERGPIVLQTQGQADVHLNEPTVLFLPRPQWHRLVADDGAGADVVCGTIALGGGVHNPVSASLPDVVQVPLSALPGMGALLGQGPAQYLSQWRIQTAQQLMQQGQSIQQAAHAVGYGSASAFTRAFARALGQTPGAWLTAQRADKNGS
jgi:hypothetical protein